MNNSSVMSQNDSDSTWETAPLSVPTQIIKTLATVLVMIGSFFGNSLVICVVLQSLRMRTVTNYLIVNMACADILYTLVASPPLFVMIFEGYSWAMSSRGLGIFFCQVVNFGQYTLVPVSVLTLAAIAFDRFFAILMPLKRIINKRVFNWIIVVIWVTSVAVATPTLWVLRVIEDEDGSLSCEENWEPAFDNETASKNYALILFLVIFCLPICVITVLYTVICRHLWYMKPPGETEREESKNLLKRRNSRRKVVKMLITVVLVFIVSWLPLQIANFMFFFQRVVVSESLYFACEILMRASCALNPAVYAIFSENYRQGFKRVLARCCCSKFLAFSPQRVASSSSSRHQTVPSVLRSEYALSKRSCSKNCEEAEGEDEHQM